MLLASLAFLGSVNPTEFLLITAAVLALVGVRIPRFLVRLARRAERG